MSKRMVTYSIDDADKIASIDGHAVGGGGDSINNTNPMVAAIGNVKIAAGHYTVGQQLSKPLDASYPYTPARLFIPVTSYGHSILKVNDVVFITTFSVDATRRYFYVELTCIKEGDVPKETIQYLYITFYEVNKA